MPGVIVTVALFFKQGMLGVIYDDGAVGSLELKQQGKTPIGRIEEV